jgi:hypothetical protein
LVGNSEGKRPLGRPGRRRIDNIKMNVVEITSGDVDWIGLGQDRDKWRALVNSVVYFETLSGEQSSGYTTGGFLCSAQLHIVN